MKITAIKPYIARVGARNQLVVKVETDCAIYGWGESGLSYREKAVASAIDHYAQFLLGRDPMRSGALWQEMYRSQYFEGGRVLTAAIAALDIAFHDITGKALGVPVYQLLGGKQRDLVPAFATTSAEPSAAMVEQTVLLKEAGWNCVRFIAAGQENVDHFEPRESIAVTAEWVTKARREVGHGMTLGVEYHHRLSVAEAASFCQKMPQGTIDFIEEAIRDETPSAYDALRKMTDVPFAIGEEFSSKWRFLPYVERDIMQFSRIDICNVGGFTEAMKVAGWCEAHYIDLMRITHSGQSAPPLRFILRPPLQISPGWSAGRARPNNIGDSTMRPYSQARSRWMALSTSCLIGRALVLTWTRDNWRRCRSNTANRPIYGVQMDRSPTGSLVIGRFTRAANG